MIIVLSVESIIYPPPLTRIRKEKLNQNNNMEQRKIAFDVDDTLIIPRIVAGGDMDVPNYENIAIYKWFQQQGCYMIIWSGGGKDYARMWGEKLGLNADEYRDKSTNEESYDETIDVAFDDCDVKLAKVNVKVKRLKNAVSRSEWNKHLSTPSEKGK